MVSSRVCRVLGGVLWLASAAFSQNWQAGVAAGGGFARSLPVAGAKADLTRAPVFGAFLGQDVSRYLGGEIRYTLRTGDLRLRAGSTKAVFRGQSHLVHYDVLVHATPPASPVRPFLAAGAGVRVTRGTGAESAYQPLMEYALLTRTRQVQPVISFGGGVKIRAGRRMVVRVELRDYASPFPGEVIAPAPGVHAGNWLHDVTPMIGLGGTF
jgi:hypothetical protein